MKNFKPQTLQGNLQKRRLILGYSQYILYYTITIGYIQFNKAM